MNSFPSELPNLGRPVGIPIKSMTVWPSSAVEVVSSGLGLDKMHLHLRVTKLDSGESVLVPMPFEFAHRLASQLDEAADVVRAKLNEGTKQ